LQLLEVNNRLIGLAVGIEHVGRTFQQLLASFIDLRGVQVVLLCQLGQRLLIAYGLQLLAP